MQLGMQVQYFEGIATAVQMENRELKPTEDRTEISEKEIVSLGK